MVLNYKKTIEIKSILKSTFLLYNIDRGAKEV